MTVPAGPPALRILIIDDDFLFTDMLPRLLRKEVESPTLEIATARSPTDAMSMIESQDYGVVICDYDLKAPQSGLDVLKHARTRTPTPLLILFSGHTPREIGGRLDGVIDAFVEKPMTLPEVVPVFGEILGAKLGIPFVLKRRPAKG